jgi:phospholipase C
MLLRPCTKPKVSVFIPLWISFVSALAGAAAPPAILSATTTPIQHVVVIFQENVSFDHYFATYPFAANNSPFEPAFTAAPGTPSVNGLNGSLLTHNPNSVQPFRLSRAEAVTCDQDHGYLHEQQAFNSGLMNKFVEFAGGTKPSCDIDNRGKGIVMGYCSAAGNVANGSVIGDPRPSSDFDDCTIATATQIKMSGTHVGDLLNAKGLTWGWFQGGFRPTSPNGVTPVVCGSTHTGLGGSSKDYIPHHAPFQYYPQSANQHHLPPTSVSMIGGTDQAMHQYDLSDFFAALSAGSMPAVSYLKAAAYQDGHAAYSDPLDEQTFLVNTINTIMQSPFWNSTAIIIAYDDSDGWYDHVMGPIVNQSSDLANDGLTGAGTCGNGATAPFPDRCGYGPRQPLLVISPFARPNFVDHSVTDQSSILQFIEDNWGLGRIGNNSTDDLAGSLLPMFDFSQSGKGSILLLDPATGTPAGKK